MPNTLTLNAADYGEVLDALRVEEQPDLARLRRVLGDVTVEAIVRDTLIGVLTNVLLDPGHGAPTFCVEPLPAYRDPRAFPRPLPAP